MTESEVLALIEGYEQLVQRAATVALVVLETRQERYRPTRTDGVDITIGSGMVYGRYYTRGGEYDTVDFPTSFLWSDDGEIIVRTLETMELERLKHEEFLTKQRADAERQERAHYERLKAKYEHD